MHLAIQRLLSDSLSLALLRRAMAVNRDSERAHLALARLCESVYVAGRLTESSCR